MMKYFYTVILLFVVFNTFTQRRVSGVVSDVDGEVLPGASVVVQGTENGVAADFNGKFHLLVTKNDTFLLEISSLGFLSKTIKITQDTVFNVVLEYGEYDCCEFIWLYGTKWLSVGAKYDMMNSVIGLSFSNGYDERPFIHFEDFSDKFIYQMNAQTNFYKDYSFGVNLGWKYPRFIPLTLISAGYHQYDYSSKDFFYQNTYISLKRGLFNLNIGYQILNDFNNWGTSLGVQKMLLYNKNPKGLYGGVSVGYYFDYFTYSLYFQEMGYIHRNLSFRLSYDRIDNYDFFNVGLNFIYPYKNCRCKD